MTTELAVAVPAVLLMFAACLGGLRIGTERLRLVDAAAQSARSAALGGATRPARGRRGRGARRAAAGGQTVCVALRDDVALLGLPVPVEASSRALAGVVT